MDFTKGLKHFWTTIPKGSPLSTQSSPHSTVDSGKEKRMVALGATSTAQAGHAGFKRDNPKTDLFKVSITGAASLHTC
jgi:hypothetical protein